MLNDIFYSCTVSKRQHFKVYEGETFIIKIRFVVLMNHRITVKLQKLHLRLRIYPGPRIC